ncbi:hypothetical protein EOL96_03790 [Candidatus Saccharibacteria bacterium]|nr:hypothetical protein [Candidatus Saccharibacteria bacterium]
MAGTYPNIPGNRFALDQDGSVVSIRNYTQSSAWYDKTASAGDILKVNTTNYIAYTPGINSGDVVEVAVGFPEPRNVTGIYFHAGDSDARPVESWGCMYSTDTTDGTNGTWQSFSPTFTYFGSHDESDNSSKPYYRSDVATVSLTDVRGV